jgi:hypothetical protein
LSESPTFDWDEDNLSRSGVPLLKITFPNIDGHDVAHLSASRFLDSDFDRLNEKTCIFEGHLQNEPDVPVAATGCPGASRLEVLLNWLIFGSWALVLDI